MELLLRTIRNSNNFLGTVYICHSAFYSKQVGNAMKKVMGGSKKKFKYNEAPPMPNPNAFSKGAFEGKQSVNARRVNVLNKTFMRYITDLMASGECAHEFLGHGIEINKVQVMPDYKYLHVFWIAKGTANDEVVDKILTKNAGLLRHELSQLRVMGVIPKLTFIKDKKYSEIVELDNRLSKADFGEDYTPTEPYIILKSQFELFTQLDKDTKIKIEKIDNEIDDSEWEEQLPNMPQNVLGLDHSVILDRIQKAMKKSEALHRLTSYTEDVKSVTSTNENPVEYTSGQSQRMAFKEFLHKRQITRYKNKSEDKNYIPDMEYIEEEHMEKRRQFIDSLDITYKDDNDFIYELDDDDNKNV
ncbi:unnamed protein product [Brassicogethes aeneus]|uniref:Ribosome-binding factor A, mitochondrial n=1 Tax=Brassicogethes aeneus TaxID=1431903 RepID=A0A9P0AW95_BRAAE|nr:unnamed protein product [Brassicogethes aeneus]